MFRAKWVIVLGCCLQWFLSETPLRAQENSQPEPPANKPQQKAINLSELLELGTAKAVELVQGASDLKKAAEASQRSLDSLERIMPSLSPLVLGTTENLSRLSSEFDPFGYKTAFRTVQSQNEVIQRQQQLIQELQQREIDRLQKELAAVKKKGKRRKSQSPTTGS
jgi:hypothetical protein